MHGGHDEADAAIDELITTARRHLLDASIPDELRGSLIDAAWDIERLWTIQDPVIELSLAELEWLLDLPWWKAADGGHFQVRPAEVLAHPDRHPSHAMRMASADPTFPIHVLRRRGRWMVIDGIHRTAAAITARRRTIAAIPLGLDGLRRLMV